MVNQVQKVQTDMQCVLESMKNGSTNSNCAEAEKAVEVGEGLNKRQMYFWGGKFHSVPKGFEVPRMALANFIITCWFCGSDKENMPPL